MFVNKLWPVLNIQPHPASLVHPSPANPNHFLLGGLGRGPHEGSFGSYESAARVVSLIEANCDRYVGQSLEVESSQKTGGQFAPGSRLLLAEEEREEDSSLSEGDRRPLVDPGDLRGTVDPRWTGVEEEGAITIPGVGSGGSVRWGNRMCAGGKELREG